MVPGDLVLKKEAAVVHVAESGLKPILTKVQLQAHWAGSSITTPLSGCAIPHRDSRPGPVLGLGNEVGANSQARLNEDL